MPSPAPRRSWSGATTGLLADKLIEAGRGQPRARVSKSLGKSVSRRDAEFHVHLAEMVLDRAGTDEQPTSDVGIGEPIAGEPGYLPLLRGQFDGRVGSWCCRTAAGRMQLSGAAVCKGVKPHRCERFMCNPQVLARISAPLLAAQPDQ
jgi:hypothetical protein